jgi:DNA polymerase III alpha subunit
MKIDNYGQHIYSEDDICGLYMSDTNIKLKKVIVDREIKISDIIDTSSLPKFILNTHNGCSIKEFDSNLQSKWFLPESYKNFDIAKYILDKCNTDAELQRAGEELLLFQERDMFPLLIYLKFLVDTLRNNNIVWGVGRGSSVASFVLFLLGVHKINSLYYDLNIDEFLK